MSEIKFKRLTDDRVAGEVNGHLIEIEGLSLKIAGVVISADKVPFSELSQFQKIFEEKKDLIIKTEVGNIIIFDTEEKETLEIDVQTPSSPQKLTPPKAEK